MTSKVLITCGKTSWVVMAFSSVLALVTLGQAQARNRVDLRENWLLQSSCKTNTAAEVLSTLRFSPDHWYKTTVPSTVLAAQVANGEFQDIYFGENLRKLPGMEYPIGELYSNLDVARGSPYACSWWYRTEFQLLQELKERRVWVHFNGINYKANVWLNGRKLADAEDVAGAYRIYEFDATPLLDKDHTNVLAVEVFAPGAKDFGINFVDWNPTPPDKDMGLWRDVYLVASGPVRVRYPEVVTHFPGDSLERADLTVRAEVHNDTDAFIDGILRGGFETVTFEKKVTLSPGETRSVMFTPNEFPQLRIDHPDLWWPTGLGAQKLHLLSMTFESSGSLFDSQTVSFGIREVTGELYGESPQPGEVYDNNGDFSRLKTDKRPFLIRVNHRAALIRGEAGRPKCSYVLRRTGSLQNCATFGTCT
jgi:exo-1,4-beta-D-glucosaminidase